MALKARGSPGEQPIGTGPYKLVEWRRGDQLIMEANPDYWGEAPKAQNLIFRWSSEAAQRLVELTSGNVDGIDNPGADDFDAIKANPELKLFPRTALNIFYLGMNNTKDYWKNDKIR